MESIPPFIPADSSYQNDQRWLFKRDGYTFPLGGPPFSFEKLPKIF